MAFWALDGGKGGQAEINYSKGLDTDLPEAQFREKERNDKMAIYQAAQRDSTQDGISPALLNAMGLKQDTVQKIDLAQASDERTQPIQAKLAQLQRQLNEPQPAPVTTYEEPEPAQLRRLDKFMKQAGRSGGAKIRNCGN